MAPSVPQKSLSGVITSEGGLVETPGLDLLVELGWTPLSPYRRAGAGQSDRPLPSANWYCPRVFALRFASSTPRCPMRRCSRPNCAHRRPFRDAAGGGKPRGLPAVARRHSRCRCASPTARSRTSASPPSTGRILPPTTSFCLAGLDREQPLLAAAGRARLR